MSKLISDSENWLDFGKVPVAGKCVTIPKCKKRQIVHGVREASMLIWKYAWGLK